MTLMTLDIWSRRGRQPRRKAGITGSGKWMGGNIRVQLEFAGLNGECIIDGSVYPF